MTKIPFLISGFKIILFSSPLVFSYLSFNGIGKKGELESNAMLLSDKKLNSGFKEWKRSSS